MKKLLYVLMIISLIVLSVSCVTTNTNPSVKCFKLKDALSSLLGIKKKISALENKYIGNLWDDYLL